MSMVTKMILVIVILKLWFAGHSLSHGHSDRYEFSHGNIVTLVSSSVSHRQSSVDLQATVMGIVADII